MKIGPVSDARPITTGFIGQSEMVPGLACSGGQNLRTQSCNFNCDIAAGGLTV